MVELEYRLYYDDNGKAITYTTEKLPGKYLVITREQYAESRMDVKIIDDKIIRTNDNRTVFVMRKSSEGVRTSKYDINIIVDDDEYNTWTLTANERL